MIPDQAEMVADSILIALLEIRSSNPLDEELETLLIHHIRIIFNHITNTLGIAEYGEVSSFQAIVPFTSSSENMKFATRSASLALCVKPELMKTVTNAVMTTSESTTIDKLIMRPAISDLLIKVSGETAQVFPSSKSLLMEISPVFNAMLSGPFLESSSREIELIDVDPNALQLFLFFAHSGSFPDPPKPKNERPGFQVSAIKRHGGPCDDWFVDSKDTRQIIGLMEIANKFMVDRLREMCKFWIQSLLCSNLMHIRRDGMELLECLNSAAIADQSLLGIRELLKCLLRTELPFILETMGSCNALHDIL
jgi:hypothetical protein